MALDQTPAAGLAYGWDDGASGWGGPMNVNLLLLDVLAVPFAMSATTTAPPSSPTAGVKYIIPAGATGEWASLVGRIAVWAASQWVYYQPKTGWNMRVWDTRQTLVWDGTAWIIYLDTITPATAELIADAAGAADDAAASAAAAAASAAAAVTTANASQTSATAAAASAAAALVSKNNAASHADDADTSATEAAASATAAANSASTAVSAAATSVASSSSASAASAAAVTAAASAATAKTGAETAQAAAVTARTGAETAQAAAVTARTGAEAARDAAWQYASTGTVCFRMATIAPVGWIKANGGTIGNALSGATNRANADCQALFTLLWQEFFDSEATVSGGRGVTAEADWAAGKTIVVPDMRGEFIRAWDDSRGVDSARLLGTFQDSQNRLHNHTGTTDANGDHTHTVEQNSGMNDGGNDGSDAGGAQIGGDQTGTAGIHTHTFTTGGSGGNEARPRNRALLCIVKL